MLLPPHASRCLSTVSLTLALSGLLALVPAAAASAQQNNVEQNPAGIAPPPQQLPALKMKETLDQFLGYDPAERAPLVIVLDPAATFKPEPRQPRLSLTTAARIFARKVVSVGGALALVPTEMTVIETNPGKPNLYEGLENHEKIQILLGSLTEAQWQLIGSEQGLGVNDLSRDIRPLFLSLMPPKVTVNTIKIEPGEGRPDAVRFDTTTVPPVDADPATIRLRAVRSVSFLFKQSGGNSYALLDGATMFAPGDVMRSLNFFLPSNQEEKQTTQFGVRLLKKLPSKLKFSQLAYDAPGLNAPVLLTPDMKTVGDALKQAAAATGLELLADARARDLPFYSQGSRIRTGDLLGAIAWNVTGTFRRLGERTFLLTDDVEGIGSRFLKLREWEQAAQLERTALMEKLLNKSASLQPLRYISYDASDPTAPPPEVQAKMEQSLKKPTLTFDPSQITRTADLSPALQDRIRRTMDAWNVNSAPLEADKVQLQMRMQIALVVPGVGSVMGTNISSGLDTSFIRRLMPEENQAAKTVPEPPPVATVLDPAAPVFPPALKRRILLLALPEEKDAALLLNTARERGFTEVWLRGALEKPEVTVRRMTAAVTSGKTVNLPVGMVLPLLKDNSAGDDERNIFQETGQVSNERYLKALPLQSPFISVSYARYVANLVSGWRTVEDPASLARQVRATVAPLASAGICAVVLTHTAAPGYTGESQFGGGLSAGAQMGYTVSNRLAFLRKAGYDPIDLPQDKYGWGLRLRGELPFFSAQAFRPRWISDGQQGNSREDTSYVSPVQQWLRFRADRNRALLQPVYTLLSSLLPPTSPLYINDRASDFSLPNAGWFGTWDKAETLPLNPPYRGDDIAVKAAKAASKTILFNYKTAARNRATSRDEAGSSFVQSLARMAGRAAKGWNGLVVDLSTLSPAETLEMLSALPLSR